eukprot:SAG31_NODE_1487_length_8148_cov_4.926823_3_plen_290_part_00
MPLSQRGGQFELIADGGGKRETHRETHRETRNAPSSALRAADEAARAAGYEVAAALSSEVASHPSPPPAATPRSLPSAELPRAPRGHVVQSVLPEDRPWEAPAPAAARGADKGRVDRDDSDDELLEMAESRAKRGGAVRFSDYIFQPGGGGKGAMAAKAAHSDGGGGIGSGGGADIGGYDKMTDMEREALKAMEDAGVDEPAPMATAQSPAGSGKDCCYFLDSFLWDFSPAESPMCAPRNPGLIERVCLTRQTFRARHRPPHQWPKRRSRAPNGSARPLRRPGRAGRAR